MAQGLTIAEAAARCGLPDSTLRYWERVGLMEPIERDVNSRHRRYSADQVAHLETLANLRAVGLSIADMRAYLARTQFGDASAAQHQALFQAHADRLAEEIAALELRRRYLELKVRYWAARESGDLPAADVVAAELGPLIRTLNPRTLKDS